MDIANRFGVKAHGRGPKGTRFVVTIAGLTDNPTYGPCAVRGVTLTAVPTFSEEVPSEISYQWYGMPEGLIDGATQETFTPDGALADLSEIFCVVTVPSGSRSSTHAVLRETPPLVQGVLADVGYDQGTGPQVVATASVFAGSGLSFAVSGAGASIDAESGVVTIPTDTVMAGAVVTVTASNSGGPVSAAFQATVTEAAEDPVVVTIAGLTDNPTYGICATRGVALNAVTSGFSGDPSELSYQWHSTPGGVIAGATAETFTPDGALADLSEIYCVVTAAAGNWSSPSAILREVAPQTQGSLADAVFDLDTGLQVVATAAAFVGENLQFQVSGAGAGINALTGEVSIPTDSQVSGAVVTVTAFNSGGSVALGFQVTVEDLVTLEGAMSFGALTPAGVGGVPVAGSTITAGDPGGHWEIAGGLLVPTAAGAGALAGIYPLEFDNGDTLDVMIEDDKASARVEEIEAVFAALPTTARGLLVQDGDTGGQGRIRLAPKVFDNEMVMEPTNWLEDDDPRQSVRPVILGGLTIGGDPSGNEILRMENLTVQGFVCQLEQGPGESEFNNGIILVERPSRHVSIRQNEVWSRDLAEIIAADDFRDNLSTSRQMRAISTKVYNGTNEHIRIEKNWMHDVSRGAGMVATNSYQGQRSRLCGNVIEDCYTNFFTCGSLNGLDIFDNLCMGVYAANGDTTGAIPATSPHSAAGGSFDAPGGPLTTANVSLIGNLFHTGWKRTKIHEDLGLPVPAIGATGIKFNDPQDPASYYNLVIAFNTVISHGICLEVTGASATGFNDIFNNALYSEDYAGAGSAPVVSFGGASNVRMFNNIACNYDLNVEDDQGTFPATLDTLIGYGNLQINGGSGDFGELDYLVGDAAKGLTRLTLDEALLAYVPKPTTRAMTAAQKKGALGTGLYAGDGVHGVTYAPPTATGASHAYPLTTWDGSAYLSKSGGMINVSGYADGLTLAFKGETSAAVDAVNAMLFGQSGERAYFRKLGSGTLDCKTERASDGATLIKGNSPELNLSSAAGMVDCVVSMNFAEGFMIVAQGGVIEGFYSLSNLSAGDMSIGSAGVNRVFGDIFSVVDDIWQGNLGCFYLDDAFVDLETDAGLSAFYAADGSFKDFGADGSVPTGSQPLIFVAGDAAAITATPNRGRGGVFQLVGSIADEDTQGPTITGLAPAQGETDVSIHIAPAVTFSEPVAFGSGLITLYDVDGGAALESFDVAIDQGSGAGQVEINGAVLTIHPTDPLGHEVNYAVQIEAAAITDLAGNAFAGVTDTTTIRFATVPGVAGFNPTSVSLVSFAGSATETVTIPGGIQAGDIILLEGLGIESSSTGTFGSAPGFVSVGQAGEGGQRKAHFMAKVADGTETGDVTPVGDSGNGTGSGAVVLRLDVPATALSFLGADIGIGLGAPNPKSVPAGTYNAPVLVYAFYHVLAKNLDIGARNFNGMTADIEQRLLIDGADDLWCKVRLLKEGDTMSDIAASLNSDHGGYNMVGIGAIQLA